MEEDAHGSIAEKGLQDPWCRSRSRVTTAGQAQSFMADKRKGGHCVGTSRHPRSCSTDLYLFLFQESTCIHTLYETDVRKSFGKRKEEHVGKISIHIRSKQETYLRIGACTGWISVPS